jgi:hypothetical protein
MTRTAVRHSSPLIRLYSDMRLPGSVGLSLPGSMWIFRLLKRFLLPREKAIFLGRCVPPLTVTRNRRCLKNSFPPQRRPTLLQERIKDLFQLNPSINIQIISLLNSVLPFVLLYRFSFLVMLNRSLLGQSPYQPGNVTFPLGILFFPFSPLRTFLCPGP